METVFIIGFLLIGLLTSLCLIFFSRDFNNFHAMNNKSAESFFSKIKNNATRMKQVRVS